MERNVLNKLTEAPLSDCENAASFLQSDFWGEFKASFSWRVYAFHAAWINFKEQTSLLVLYKKLLPGIGFAYVPWGPELPEEFPADSRNRALLETARAVKPFLPADTAFIRFDPAWFSAMNDAPPSIFKPFTRAAADIQPPDTVILDLDPPLDAILAQMKPKWRYNIRLGGRKTCVSRPDAEGLDVFYALFKETALRDGIAVHESAYYKRLFDIAALKTGIDMRLYLAEADDKPVAGIITLFRGKTATYLYGASSNANRNLMAAYALQWQAIHDAKEAGCAVYDLFGIPPDASPSHPMAGLYLFKTGFGGRIIHRPGSWDYAYKLIPAAVFCTAEKFRKTFRDAKKRKSRRSRKEKDEARTSY
ncbi:MAG: peptidoglycan bridge formation glycyltransferase FemA/FemB family protein [Spirochaetaceae bacterium]|jgi:lipid II:glycine glycyltransferase (peptidoglycan interpeptide bridge formation enzyme)|nr:peptidoglycan bridge formation glycyltransferase FemA/FemB family protein [Spirochaetaceae bacterium]